MHQPTAILWASLFFFPSFSSEGLIFRGACIPPGPYQENNGDSILEEEAMRQSPECEDRTKG